MKPWMWGATVLVALIVIAVLIGLFRTPVRPDIATAPMVATPATDPTPPPVDPGAEILDGVTDGSQIPLPPLDQAAPDPDAGPDITPEHVEREAFDEVLEEVIETCGLGAWSELERGCTDWRCTTLLAVAPDDSQPYPDVQGIVACPAWKDTWGTAADFTVTRVECGDGTVFDIASLGPSTLRMRRAVEEQGDGEAFVVQPDALQARACSLWGQ